MYLNLSPTTNLVIDTLIKKSFSAKGSCDSTNHELFGIDRFKLSIKKGSKDVQIADIPYDAYKLIEMAQNLITMADTLIRDDINLNEIRRKSLKESGEI